MKVRARLLSRLEVGVLCFGLIVVAGVHVALSSTSATFARDLPLTGVTQDMKLHLTQSHVWLEEWLSGDTTIDVDQQIEGNLSRADELCSAMVNGGQGRFGWIAPARDIDDRARLRHLCAEIDRLRGITGARLETAATSASGSVNDQAYDATFDHLIEDIDRETLRLESTVRTDQERLRQFNAGFVALLSLLFFGMAGLVRRNRRAIEIKNTELAKMAAIVQSSDDAISGVDSDGIITSWNAAAERVYGYRADEIVGRPASVLVPEALQEEGPLIDRARRGESVNNVGTQRLRKDGTVFDVALTVSRIVLDDGGLRGFSVIARDVTERKRMEAELAAARDQALEASRLKSEFLANMSHEIRTPMNGVIGLSGLLLATDLDVRQRQYAEGVQGAAHALLGVINDILDFSKIEAGKLEVEVVDFDLRQVVEEAADLLADPARRKSLELVAHCDPRLPPTLRGDPGRLRQVLVNLVSNAVKFTERGEVVVRARPTEGPGNAHNSIAVEFEVVDTGIGIDPDRAQQLFEPFAQADASTTRRYGGTGLGLAIAADLIAAMGGDLRVDSRPGQGSRFSFTLTLEHGAVGAAARTAHLHHPLQGLRALIVDDNETYRLILCEQLSSWQLRPDAIADGPSALERLREAADQGAPYELALVDMCMTPIDGLELARRVRVDPRLAEIHLILLSSEADVDAAAAAEAGLSASLTKPVRQSQLYDTLLRVMFPEPEKVAAMPTRRSPPAAPLLGRLLVVEDNATNQMVARGILEKLGYSADVAGDGLTALQALEEVEYLAVLMDCQMPEMDGYQATAEIRRREGQGRRLPIIAMTAGAMEGDRDRCLASGMDDYVSKPVDPRELQAALDRQLGGIGAAGRNPPLDPARLELLRRMGPGDGVLLARMAEAFLAQTPTDLVALEEAVADCDSAASIRAAHRLRGAAANLGVTSMAATCREIEDLARADMVDSASGLVIAVRVEFARVARALAILDANDAK